MCGSRRGGAQLDRRPPGLSNDFRWVEFPFFFPNRLYSAGKQVRDGLPLSSGPRFLVRNAAIGKLRPDHCEEPPASKGPGIWQFEDSDFIRDEYSEDEKEPVPVVSGIRLGRIQL